ncbi:MAG: LON peptidase substrate-binding domain-containing protein [Fimbriimonadales bacterium]
MRTRRRRIQLLPLTSVLLPYQAMPLHIFEPRYAKLLSNSIAKDEPFGIVLIRFGDEVGDPDVVPHWVGTLARIVACKPTRDGEYHAIAMGEERFQIFEVERDGDTLVASVEPLEEEGWRNSSENFALLSRARAALKEHLQVVFGHQDMALDVDIDREPAALSFAIAGCLGLEPLQRQRLIEVTDTAHRLASLIPLLEEKTELMHSVSPRASDELYAEYLSRN